MAVLIVAAVLALLAALTVRAEAGPHGEQAEPGPHDQQPGRHAVGEPRSADARDEQDEKTDEEPEDVLDGPCADCDVATLSRLAARGPSVADVVAAAERAAGVASGADPTSSWRRRSRWSSLVPWITVRAANTQSWRDVDDPTLLTVHHAAAFDGRLAWHLDHLVFDPDEPRFMAFELSRRRERRKLAAIASRAYFTWLRAAIATERDTRWQLRLAEAELDALTDGWFSRALAEVRHKVPPPAFDPATQVR